MLGQAKVTSAARQYGHAEPPQDPKLKIAPIAAAPESRREIAQLAMASDDIKALGRKILALETLGQKIVTEMAALVARITALEGSPREAKVPKVVATRKRAKRG